MYKYLRRSTQTDSTVISKKEMVTEIMEETNKNAPADKGSGNNKQGGNKRLAIIIGIAAVVIIALVIVIVFLLNRPETPSTVIEDGPVPGGRGIVVVPDNIEELRDKVNETVEDGYYNVQMNNEWVFATWDAPSGNAYVENPLTNTRTVYIDVKLADTDELVYSSPYIPLGAKLENFALDSELPAGEYDAIVTFNLVDDDYKDITNLAVTVKLYIQA